MEIIQTENMPKPNGHYSNCIKYNGLLYLSGQLPKNLETGEFETGIENQTKRVLNNIKLILNEAGSDINKILQIRIYIAEIEYWDIVNKIYAEFFEDHKPVRTIVPVNKLHYNVLIEIEAIAIA